MGPLGNVMRSAGFAALLASGAVTGCSMSETMNHGYQLNQGSLDLVPEGSSRDQVLLSLGTPSTTLRQGAEDNETFYYISQQKRRPVQFTQAKVVSQRVLAVYFDENDNVSRIADYGLKEGKVFDFVRRVTPTGGKDISFIGQLLGAAGSVANPFGTSNSGASNGQAF
ncbi:MAG: outer membrane protein assembly factor BamE [Pseudomonadota bacterium]